MADSGIRRAWTETPERRPRAPFRPETRGSRPRAVRPPRPPLSETAPRTRGTAPVVLPVPHPRRFTLSADRALLGALLLSLGLNLVAYRLAAPGPRGAAAPDAGRAAAAASLETGASPAAGPSTAPRPASHADRLTRSEVLLTSATLLSSLLMLALGELCRRRGPSDGSERT